MRQVRFTATIAVKDDEQAEEMIRHSTHPIHGQLADVYWQHGSLETTGVQGQREWIDGELSSYQSFETRAAEWMRQEILRELRRGSWRDNDTLGTVRAIVEAIPIPKRFP